MSKGKDPKVPVRLECQKIRSALISRKSNSKRNPHAILGTHQTAHTTNPEVDAHGGLVCFQAHRQSQ